MDTSHNAENVKKPIETIINDKEYSLHFGSCFGSRLKYWDYDYSTEYDLNNGNEIIENLNLIIGSDIIARFYYAAHKTNLAIRKAIQNNDFVLMLFKEMSKFVTSSRKSNRLADIHSEKKRKLQKQNFTRWSSSFKMLFSFLNLIIAEFSV